MSEAQQAERFGLVRWRAVRRASRSETVRTVQKVLLVKRLQDHDDRLLEHLVFIRRDPQRTFLSFAWIVSTGWTYLSRPIFMPGGFAAERTTGVVDPLSNANHAGGGQD